MLSLFVMREIFQEAGSSDLPSILDASRRSNRVFVAVATIRWMSSNVAVRAAMRECASYETGSQHPNSIDLTRRLENDIPHQQR